MARHPTARRVHRPSATAEDAFTAHVIEWSAWAKENARSLLWAGAILILAITVGLYLRNFRNARQIRAQDRLAQLHQTAASGNWALAARDIEAFLASFDGTDAASEARLLLAKAYLHEGQPEKAIDAVQTIAGDLDGTFGTSAAMLLGAAYEAAGQAEQAEAVYLRVADGSDAEYIQREALDSAARLRMARGDAAGAAELYERVLDLLDPTSPERGIYELRLAEANAAQQG
ncbi:MAG TPA: tetratricopeptide repeat protein [Longimicrobiales bacterium]